MTDSTTDTAPLWRRALSAIGIHLLIAGALTIFLIGSRWTWRELWLTLGVNLVFTLCISTATTTMFASLLPRLKLEGWRAAVAKTVGFAVAVFIGSEAALFVFFLAGLPVQNLDRMMVWRIAGVVTFVMLVITLGYDRLRAHARAVELREEQARAELLEAQLSNLRARLNPHFLFNSLNSLAGLIEEDPPRAVEALERLCDLLRHGLESTDARRTSLGKELDVLRDYLAMEQLRFGDRLRWTLDVSPELHVAEVPTLLLQPVVENAVKYAVAPRRAGGTIEIEAAREGNVLSLTVLDDGPGTAAEGGTKLGERTLRERLELEYGDAATVHAGPRDDGGYRVALRMPFEGEAR
ncbi:MAG: histidine kinase [Myxococcota bacterium]